MLKFTSTVRYTSRGPTYIESFLTIFGQCINVLNYKYIYWCKRIGFSGHVFQVYRLVSWKTQKLLILVYSLFFLLLFYISILCLTKLFSCNLGQSDQFPSLAPQMQRTHCRISSKDQTLVKPHVTLSVKQLKPKYSVFCSVGLPTEQRTTF